jgi:hypothetical protein
MMTREITLEERLNTLERKLERIDDKKTNHLEKRVEKLEKYQEDTKKTVSLCQKSFKRLKFKIFILYFV